jgi:hypothetical protein
VLGTTAAVAIHLPLFLRTTTGIVLKVLHGIESIVLVVLRVLKIPLLLLYPVWYIIKHLIWNPGMWLAKKVFGLKTRGPACTVLGFQQDLAQPSL